MRLTRIFVIFVFLVLGLVPDALGGVNLKNGNFYISYTDVEFDSKFQIQRTYNSKSTEIGFFGFGWGSDFETFLVVLPDRSVMVFENGAGSKTRFESPKPDPQAYEAGIQKVIEIAKMLKEVESEQSVKNLEAKIRSGGVEALIRHWLKYKKSGLVESPVIPVGTVLQSGARGDQTIRRVADGFLRVDYEGTREYFNRDGLLVRQVLKNDDEFTLTYDGSNVLKTITDGRGRTAKFKFNNVGQVENIEAVEGTTPSKRAVYSYSSEQQLIASTDAGGNNYKHEYDAASNMTRVRYTDGTSMDIAYHPGTMFTRSIKDRNGEKTLYDYAGDSSGDQYSTTVKKLTSTGEVMSTNSYEYFIKADEFGNRWTQRIIITIDGRKTDTEYDKNNRPVVIRRNGGETKFAYDAKGRLVRKETSTEIVDMTYHERLPHFTRVENTDKKTGTKTWTAYRYDIAGNLTFAESSDGRSITLDYDALGQISAMTRKDGSKLKFKYNSLKKPIEILLVENGVSNTLNITYDKKGEIEKIDSSGGQDMALKITSAFQELLAGKTIWGQLVVLAPAISPAASEPELMENDQLTLEEKLRINADLIIEHLSPHAGFDLGFDERSVEWIDGFIERQRIREDLDIAATDGLVQKLGPFLGECLCSQLGGQWKQLDEGLAIVFSDGNAAFPLTKVRKQFANGPEDSILSFYRSAAALFSG